MYDALDCPYFEWTRECRYMKYTSCSIINECQSLYLGEVNAERANADFNDVDWQTQNVWYHHVIIFFEEFIDLTGIFAHMDFTGKKSYNRNIVQKSVLF